MVNQRNRVTEAAEYIESLGLCVNIGKTKARGNHGVFLRNNDYCRIDISKDISKEEYLSTLIHEFAHYLHFKNDPTLKSLDFVFKDFTGEMHEELINITVNSISKDFAIKLYGMKEDVSRQINELTNNLKQTYLNFKSSEKLKSVEKHLPLKYKYLLKYDKVKIFNKTYSVDEAYAYNDLTKEEADYIMLKSKQRMLARINSKIRRLNKYYNNFSELFARFVVTYSLDKDNALKNAPICTKAMDSALMYDNKMNTLKNLISIIQN